MWTVCWTDNHGDEHFQRCEHQENVMALLIAEQLQEDEDILIFSPAADDCIKSVKEVFADT